MVSPSAGALGYAVILGINKPLSADAISKTEDASGLVVPIPI